MELTLYHYVLCWSQDLQGRWAAWAAWAKKNIDEFIFHDVNTTHSANMGRELNNLSSDFFSLLLAWLRFVFIKDLWWCHMSPLCLFTSSARHSCQPQPSIEGATATISIVNIGQKPAAQEIRNWVKLKLKYGRGFLHHILVLRKYCRGWCNGVTNSPMIIGNVTWRVKR